MIPHQMRGQCAHSHDCMDDLLACELDALDVFDRFARAFEVIFDAGSVTP